MKLHLEAQPYGIFARFAESDGAQVMQDLFASAVLRMLVDYDGVSALNGHVWSWLLLVLSIEQALTLSAGSGFSTPLPLGA